MRTSFLCQYNPKQVIKMALFEKDQKFAVHISQLQTNISKNEIYQYILLNLQNVLIYFIFSAIYF
jgi:bifunctional pyridoxal-dependent enzyme with beta-cystathionase and maltose regulon repressor activities